MLSYFNSRVSPAHVDCEPIGGIGGRGIFVELLARRILGTLDRALVTLKRALASIGKSR